MRKLRDVFDDPKSLHNGSPGDELSVYSEPLYRKPTNIQTVALVGSYVGRRVREHVRRMYAPEQWALAYCASSEEGPQTSLYRFKEQLPPVGTSWADPFPVDEGNGFCVFFEEFDHATRRGHVAVSRLTRGGHFEAPVKIVERPHHLSYPFVFTWRGAWFMMPESSAASRIEIFAARKFPFEWTLEAVLFDSIRAVDSTLVKVADRWWLFTNINSHPATRNYDELSAFHAPTPFGPWTPHRRNPVKSDARSARSAGRFFQRNGNLFRPAQDCSGRYGSATIINRIEMLTCDTFEETAVTRVEPRWRAGLSGTHTLNHCPGLTVIDFRHRRTSFTPVAFRRDSDRRVAS
jgi:hypothetical protein